MRCTPMRCTPIRCTPIRCMPIVQIFRITICVHANSPSRSSPEQLDDSFHHVVTTLSPSLDMTWCKLLLLWFPLRLDVVAIVWPHCSFQGLSIHLQIAQIH